MSNEYELVEIVLFLLFSLLRCISDISTLGFLKDVLMLWNFQWDVPWTNSYKIVKLKFCFPHYLDMVLLYFL